MAIFTAIAGMGMTAAGKQQGLENTVEGAETRAEIEGLSRKAQDRRFQRDIKYQEPFYAAGERAAGKYKEAIKNRLDVTKSPLYTMQKEMILGELGEDAPEGLKEDALSRLEAIEGEKVKGRLLDLQKIGLGSAASAGRTALSFGAAFGTSMQRGAGTLAEGMATRASGRENIWSGVMQDISGYPAYREQARYADEPRGLGGIDVEGGVR